MATQTANGDYNYSKVFTLNKKKLELDSLVNHAHKVLSEKSGWFYNPLKKGSFGYDNLAVSIGYMLDNYKSNQSLDELADNIHKGWIKNYTFWRDNLPGKTQPEIYSAPAKPLGDKRRNDCAITAYADLPQDEKDKDIIIAEAVLNCINLGLAQV